MCTCVYVCLCSKRYIFYPSYNVFGMRSAPKLCVTLFLNFSSKIFSLLDQQIRFFSKDVASDSFRKCRQVFSFSLLFSRRSQLLLQKPNKLCVICKCECDAYVTDEVTAHPCTFTIKSHEMFALLRCFR